jgi:hypothetical protein
METVEAAAVDSGFYLTEGVSPGGATFLTADVVLAAAKAIAAAVSAVSATNVQHSGQEDNVPSQELAHVMGTALAVYWTALPRWFELTSRAKATSTVWPLEPTLREAFDTFSLYFNTTGVRYGALPAFAEGSGPGNLTALWDSLAPPVRCSGSSGAFATKVLANAANASSWYQNKPAVTGNWAADGFAPQWIELTYTGSVGNVAYVSAVVVMSPSGEANHTLFINGQEVTQWVGSFVGGQVLTWTLPGVGQGATADADADADVVGSGAVAAAAAAAAVDGAVAAPLISLKLLTTKSPSWVAWAEINVWTCP